MLRGRHAVELPVSRLLDRDAELREVGGEGPARLGAEETGGTHGKADPYPGGERLPRAAQPLHQHEPFPGPALA